MLQLNHILKNLFCLLLLTTCSFIYAQNNVYQSNKSSVTFYSKAPLENIEAKNNSARVKITPATQEVYARVPIRSFSFKKKLMEKHFNENYMETEKYPNATLVGKLDQSISNLSGSKSMNIVGKLTIHGETKNVTIPVTITKTAEGYDLSSEFYVKPKEYKIKIPKLMFRNIADKIKVTVKSKMIRNEE